MGWRLCAGGILLGLALCSAACGSSPLLAVQPVIGSPGAETMLVSGTVESIHFQNINKALGHFTYNVELRVAHEGVANAPDETDRAPGTLRVRVHKVYWSQLDPAEQAALAPEGPRHEMTPATWHGVEVGQPLELEVVSWGAGLAAPKTPLRER